MIKYLSIAGVVVGGILVALLLFSAIYLSGATGFDPFETNAQDAMSPPSQRHPLGTDRLGRDLQTRVFYGLRTSLSIGAGAVLLALYFGGALGVISGMCDGVAGKAVSCLTRFLTAGPGVLLAIAILISSGFSNLNIMIGAALVIFPGFTRVAEGVVLLLTDSDAKKSSRTIKTTGAIIARISLNMALAMLICAVLGFIGMGVKPPIPELGTLFAEGRNFLTASPSMTTYPALFLAVSLLAFNILGESINSLLLAGSGGKKTPGTK